MQSPDSRTGIIDESEAFEGNEREGNPDFTHDQATHQRRAHQALTGFLTVHNRTGLLKTYKPKWFVYRFVDCSVR